ncbi:endonuclease domain-containing protein [Herbiconiux sp. P16]|uniref:endonuclease domain-containing protein n=1 Tax=Herbiconiux wuyangfengii TaxID=3342794 RepID=UPI0035BB29E2
MPNRASVLLISDILHLHHNVSMNHVVEFLERAGGVASTAQLAVAGISAGAVNGAVARGAALRLRQGWVGLPGAPESVVRAVRLGGRVSCLSVLKTAGLWCAADPRMHVRVPAEARRLTSPINRGVPLGRPERFGVVVHRSHRAPFLDEPEGAVDTFAWALLHSITCQSKIDAIVTLDSALKQGRVSRTELEFLVADLPAKYRAYLALTDPNAASGLETKARLGLRRVNITSRSQVKIRGVGYVDLLVGDRLVVETDGREWHTKPEAYAADRRRDLALAELGYLVLRLSYEQVMGEWDRIVAVIRAIVARGEHRWSARHLRAGFGTGAEIE